MNARTPLLACLFFHVASALFAMNSPASPSTLKKDIPVIFHACPSWCFPRGHSEQYRYCYDRPFAPGPEPDYIWQLRTMKEAVPNSALAIYCFINDKRTVDYWSGIFQKYLEAAAQTGTKVFPCIHSVSSDVTARPGDLLRLSTTLLEKYGQHPSWFQWEGRPFLMDYGSGGLRETKDFIPALQARRQAAGRPFFYVTEPLSDTQWAVKGEFSPDYIHAMLQEADGLYHFTQPLDKGLGGYKELGREIRKTVPRKIYGAGIQPGYYSARKNQRNFISSRGTQTLRKGFQAAWEGSPDFLHVKTWNDWVEATSVEPSYKHTHALLDLIASFSTILNGAPFPTAAEPHVVASYRKNIFPAETLTIELVNLPVSPAFDPLSGKITVTTAAGKFLAEQPFANLAGDKLEAVERAFSIPENLGREMLRVVVELQGKQAGKPFRRSYAQLPPVPVVTNSAQADMLHFHVPLHRLNGNAAPRLLLNGATDSGPLSAAAGPRSLWVQITGKSEVAGISYLKNGFVINDPDAASAGAPVIDNWMSDPTLRGQADGHDYYGALVAFTDGSIAYSDGLWARDAQAQGVWAAFQFEEENRHGRYLTGIPGVLRDLSGQQNHGTPAALPGKKTPRWKNLAAQFDSLEFDGQGGVLTFANTTTPPGALTVELMIRPDEIGREQEIFIQRGATLSLRLETDGRVSVRRLDENRNLSAVVSPTALVSGRWHQLTATYDLKSIRLYIDGKPAGERPAGGLRSSEQVTLGGPIGAGPNDVLVDQTKPDSYFKGAIGALRILDGALESEVIQEQARQSLNLFAGF